jgi:large subunit ribosomal protein L16
MLQPIRTKFRKAFKGRIHGAATSGNTLAFGQYGLKALEPERVTARQIEAARRALTRFMKRSGRVWIRVFPDVPVSKKPTEVRMGKGKGTPELWVVRVKPGRILFEVDGIPVAVAREALALAAAKLPVKTRFIERIAMKYSRLRCVIILFCAGVSAVISSTRIVIAPCPLVTNCAWLAIIKRSRALGSAMEEAGVTTSSSSSSRPKFIMSKSSSFLPLM